MRRGGWALGALALVLSGCSHGITAQATVVQPAAVPVRAYPEIWVAGGFLEEDEIVLAALLRALSSGGEHRVRRLDPDELEPRRRAGRIPQTAVVLVVDVRVQEDVRQMWDTQPVRMCGPYGCETRYQQVSTHVPWVRGTVQLRVHEGPSARLLQRHVLRSDRYGGDPQELRVRVAEQLASLASEAVSVVERTMEVELLPVQVAPVEAALGHIRAGDWQAGRKALEAAVRAAEVQRLSPEDRARVFYDLGLARRFAPRGGYSDRAFDAAARAFKQASRLDPRPSYARALSELEAHRDAHARLMAQRDAAAHNFSLDREAEGLPPPPPSYRLPAVPDAPPAAVPRGGAPPEPASPPPPVPEQAFEPDPSGSP